MNVKIRQLEFHFVVFQASLLLQLLSNEKQKKKRNMYIVYYIYSDFHCIVLIEKCYLHKKCKCRQEKHNCPIIMEITLNRKEIFS